MKFKITSFQIVVRPKKASNRILDSDSDSDEEEEGEAGNIPPFRTFLQNIATSKKVLDTSDGDDDAGEKIRRMARVSEAGETLISSSDDEGKVRRGQTIVYKRVVTKVGFHLGHRLWDRHQRRPFPGVGSGEGEATPGAAGKVGDVFALHKKQSASN